MEAAAEASRMITETVAIRNNHSSHTAVAAAVDRDSLNRDHLPQPVVMIHTQLVSLTLYTHSRNLTNPI